GRRLEAERGRGAGGVRRGRGARRAGSETEAREITPALRVYAKQPPTVLLGKKAVKAAVLATRSPRVLVLSTHGFFLASEDEGESQENPLLRSGVLLAGAVGGEDGGRAGLGGAGAGRRGGVMGV